MQRALRRTLKKGVLGLAHSTGLFSLYADSERRRRRLLILCYHGIAMADEDTWRGTLYISPEQFRRRMQLLRRNDMQVLGLGEALRALRAGSLPKRSVVITFDDGFYDFHLHAAPVLRDFGYPCTLYLTTHYCHHRLPVFGVTLQYMLWKRRDRVADLSSLGLSEQSRFRDDHEQCAIAAELERRAAGLSTAAKDEIVRQVAGILDIDYGAISGSRMFQNMSPEEVAAAARMGIDIQLHTHRHRTPRDRALFVREIEDNRSHIREMTGRDCVHFCYPSGDYAPEFLPWLRECGVESATTCELGLATADSEPLLLPRLLDATNISEADLESWLCGFRS